MWLISGWHEALEFDALTRSMTWDETARFYVFSLLTPLFIVIHLVLLLAKSLCAIYGTMLQKLSKCKVKAWLCCNLIFLQPLTFYVKSNFGKFKQSKNIIFAIIDILNFEIWDLKATQNYLNQNSEPLKLAKITFLDRLNLPKFDFTYT